MTQLERLLSIKEYDIDLLLNKSCPMNFGMRGDTSLCPTGCKTCWDLKYLETDYSKKFFRLLKINHLNTHFIIF